MAKYIGLLTSDARGKLGGIVMSRGRSGTTLKSKSIPVNPSSSRQNKSRNWMTTALNQWKGLGQTAQLTWQTLASAQTFYNSLGQAYSPTGQQLFVSAAVNNAMFPTISMGSAPSSYPPIDAVAFVNVTNTAGDLSIIALDSGSTEIANYNIYASRLVSQGINYPPQNISKWLGPAEAGSGQLWNSEYLSIYGYVPQPGDSLVVEILPYDITTMLPGTRMRGVVPVG